MMHLRRYIVKLKKDSVIQKRKNRDSGIDKTNVSVVISSIEFDQLLYNFDQRRLD